MAVIPGFPLRMSVRIAGQIAREFNDPDSTNVDSSGLPTASCYIESKADAEFSIEVAMTDAYGVAPPHDIFITVISIDGAPVSSLCSPPGTITQATSHVHSQTQIPSLVNGTLVCNRFAFGSVNTGMNTPPTIETVVNIASSGRPSTRTCGS